MPEILVEFVPDYTKLQTGLDQLAAGGQVDKEFANVFKNAQKPLDDLAKKATTTSKTVKRDLDAIRIGANGMSKSMNDGLKNAIGKALKEAGEDVNKFKLDTEKLIVTEKSLKQQFREAREELAKMKLEGKENTKQYEELIQRAGKLADTLADVAAETRRVGSDTRKIDTVIEIVQGLGAAYQIAQGAAALLGEDNEELQKGLLRLQAIMAITNGVQQTANLLQKESNALRLITTIQLRAQSAATNLQTAAQSRNVIVSGAATVAMRLLNVVMSANPALLLVTAFAALAGALAAFSGKANRAEVDAANLNNELQRQKDILDDTLSANQNALNIRLKNAEAAGASEKELFQIRQDFNRKDLDAIEEQNRFRAEENQIRLDGTRLYIGTLEEARLAREKLNEAEAEGGKKTDEQVTNARKIIDAQISGLEKARDVRSQISEDEADENLRRVKEAKELADKQKVIDLQKLQDVKTRIETQLLSEREGTQKFLKLQVDLAEAEKNIGLFNSKSLAEKKKVVAEFLVAVDKITTDFYAADEKKALDAQISLLNAKLSNVKLEADERDRLTLKLIEKNREAELSAENLTAEKRKEINAKFDREIAEQRLAFLRSQFDEELRFETAKQASRKRFLEDVASDNTRELDARSSAIDQLEEMEIRSIENKRDLNKKAFDQGLITVVEYNTTVQELKDDELLAHETAEKRKTAITEAESEKRKQKLKEEVLAILAVADQIASSLDSIVGAITDSETFRLQIARHELEQLNEAGALTEKQYNERLKRQELAERQAKRRAAQREKDIQIFQAIIAGARAVVEAAPNPFMIALTAALVAAQIAIIAARPIPKFGKGTKRAPRGFAEVGETGTEIIHDPVNKKAFLAENSQIIWLKGGERIYNPQETKTILKSRTPHADSQLTNVSTSGGSTFTLNEGSLAKKIGDEISKHPRIVVKMDEDGFTAHVQDSLSNTKYRNKQYTFNG